MRSPILQYGFVLYAHDGEPDRIRLVVWDLAEGPIPGDTLVYDNARGADFDIDHADLQAIDGGSITVHN